MVRAPERREHMRARDIGATVRALRTELGYSTTKLAREVGISQAQVSKLECGQQGFRSDTVARIAEALKVPAFRLFMTNNEWRRWSRRK
mgnify:CR=1 FL=1